MGRVWRATDVVLHREVAIKELVPPPGLTPAERQEMRERSLREARAIARLNNINVVRVFDVLRTDADPWIVMEYVPSRSLQDTLAKDGPFNAVRTAEIGLGVLNALKAAHRAGVVHRDVKPGNVLMGGDGRVVLTDFGLATVPGDPNVTRTGLVLGSPAYIAPERARDGTAGPAADLWSLGATLYAAVEGQSPFARPSAIATLAALATENVPQARNAGPLKPVLNGLLRKDPAHRIDAEEAERLLARAAGRRSKLSFPMSPTMRRPGVGRERPSLPSGPGGPPVLPGSGFVTATGSAPVVPTPRPRPADAPSAGTPEQPGGRPVFTPGKATVSRPTPPARPGQRPQDPAKSGTEQAKPRRPLDPTRVDGPAVRDEPVKPTTFGTPSAPGSSRSGAGTTPGRATPADPQRPGQPPRVTPADAQRPGQPPRATPADPQRPGQPPRPAQQPQRPAQQPQRPAQSSSPLVNTARVGFTAADVAANRRKKAAPEHEASLAAATGAYPVVATPEPEAEPVEETKAAAAPPVTEPETVDTPSEAPEGPTSTEAGAPKPAEAAAEPVVAEPAEAEAEADSEATEKPVSEPEAKQSEAEAEQAPETTEPAEAAAEPEAKSKPEPKAEQKPEQEHEPETEQDAEEKAEPAESPAAVQRPATALTPGRRPATSIPDRDKKPVADQDKTSGADQDKTSGGDRDKTSVVDFTAIVPQSPAATDADGATRVVSPLSPADGATRVVPPLSPADGATRVVPPLPPADGATRVVSPLSPAGPEADGATRVVSSLPPAGGFAPSQRPAWNPMPVRPVVRRVNGITVFGTTLTRRQAVIGAAIVLTFLLLVGIILVQAFGGDNDDKATGATPAAVASGKPSAAATGGAPPSKGAASSSPSAPAAGVPADWKTSSQSGYAVALPPKAEVDRRSGTESRFEWNNRLLIIFRFDDGGADPVKALQEAKAESGYNTLSGPAAVTYQGRPAADWEYTYTTGGGNPQHVLKRSFSVGDKTYQICWYTSPEDWDAAKKDLDAVLAGFKLS
ncbi:hypothetical protein GCM10023107_26250 [Actinoplanes octamycinicus]|nr:hypothetical protein Aoc01nite_56680 [Actinoplanes octamycinicus]